MKQFEKATPIKPEELLVKNESYLKDPMHTVLRHTLANAPITTVANGLDNAKVDDFVFSIDVPTMTATNQKSSGRCWIFAACNVLREIIGKKMNIKDFELSQSYVAFFDRLEKINYELESIIDFVKADHDDRTLCHIIENGLGDGGQWDMLVNIIEKYGLAPKMAMEETYQSSNTRQMNYVIATSIRKFAAQAQKLAKENKFCDAIIFSSEKLESVFKKNSFPIVVTLLSGSLIAQY